MDLTNLLHSMADSISWEKNWMQDCSRWGYNEWCRNPLVLTILALIICSVPCNPEYVVNRSQVWSHNQMPFISLFTKFSKSIRMKTIEFLHIFSHLVSAEWKPSAPWLAASSLKLILFLIYSCSHHRIYGVYSLHGRYLCGMKLGEGITVWHAAWEEDMLCKMLPHQILCHRPNQSLSIVFFPGHSARHITMGYMHRFYIFKRCLVDFLHWQAMTEIMTS